MADVVVYVEVPSGSRNKYELDPELGGIVLDRRLFTSMSYPADYGFIEGTMGEDGDPLDALVLVGEPTFPGCRIRVRVVGVFHMTDEKGPDEKVICVPLKDPAWMRVSDIHDIPPEFRDEIEHFFQVYKDLEEGKTETRGFGNRADAEQVIEEARARASDGRLSLSPRLRLDHPPELQPEPDGDEPGGERAERVEARLPGVALLEQAVRVERERREGRVGAEEAGHDCGAHP